MGIQRKSSLRFAIVVILAALVSMAQAASDKTAAEIEKSGQTKNSDSGIKSYTHISTPKPKPKPKPESKITPNIEIGGKSTGFVPEYYTAVTSGIAHKQGRKVITKKLTWRCQRDRCTFIGPDRSFDDLSTCRALARVVGPIKSFVHSGRGLNTSQLLQCNAVLATPIDNDSATPPLQAIDTRPMFPEGRGAPKEPKVAEVPLDPLPQPTGTTGIHRELPGRITVPRDPVLVDVSGDGGSRIASTVGPIISGLYRVTDCPYPDPLARVLGYRVANAPDGTVVKTIEIFRVIGAASERIYMSPEAGSSAAPETVKDNIIDPSASVSVSAYVLVATDVNGRTMSKRLNVNYGSSEPTFEFTRKDYGEAHSQIFTFRMGGLALNRGITAQLEVSNSFGGTVHEENVDSISITGISEYPTDYYSRVTARVLTFHTSAELLADGSAAVGGRIYPEYKIIFNLDLVRQPRCSFGQRTISLEYNSRSETATIPAAPEPDAPESTDSNDGYRYRISCDCTYDPRTGDADPSTYEAPGFENETVQIQSCLSNDRGVQWPCNRLPGRMRWASTSCIASGSEQLDEEPTCHADAIPFPDSE